MVFAVASTSFMETLVHQFVTFGKDHYDSKVAEVDGFKKFHIRCRKSPCSLYAVPSNLRNQYDSNARFIMKNLRTAYEHCDAYQMQCNWSSNVTRFFRSFRKAWTILACEFVPLSKPLASWMTKSFFSVLGPCFVSSRLMLCSIDLKPALS